MSSTVAESGRDVPRGTSSGAEPSSSHPAAGCSSACAAIAASSALRIHAPVSGGPIMPDAAFVIPFETVIGPQSSARPAADPGTMRLRRVRHRRRPVPCSEEDLDGPIRRAHRRFDPPGPPTRTCSTRRRIASPRSSTGRCTPTRDQRRRMPSRARRCRVTCPAPSSSGGVARGGWWIIFEPELHLGEDIVVPDLAGWHREHMPELPDTAYFALAPDWVCEVLSASRLVTTRGRREGRGGGGYASARRETVRNSRCGRLAPQPISVSGPSSSSVNPLSSK